MDPMPAFGLDELSGANASGLMTNPVSDLFREHDESRIRTTQIAKSAGFLVMGHLMDYSSTRLARRGKGVVTVLDGEHGAQMPQRIHWGCRARRVRLGWIVGLHACAQLQEQNRGKRSNSK